MPSLTKLETGEVVCARTQIAGQRYKAVLRLSEALSQCREPEDLTAILAEELREFLAFLQFYIIVYRENSDEVEWAVVGREKSLVAAYANVPVQERPSWQAYKTQEPFYEASRRSVTMRTDLADGLPKVMADRVQLQLALVNLVLNGLEAIRDVADQALSFFQPVTQSLETPRQCVARA